ncbi:hypothetical protein BKA83DRAFT_4130601 [Pisolithus microcarpus]|nr:hypothetical protein BKA83DRAFT_4130601 [Pisolithus microcarpus]
MRYVKALWHLIGMGSTSATLQVQTRNMVQTKRQRPEKKIQRTRLHGRDEQLKVAEKSPHVPASLACRNKSFDAECLNQHSQSFSIFPLHDLLESNWSLMLATAAHLNRKARTIRYGWSSKFISEVSLVISENSNAMLTSDSIDDHNVAMMQKTPAGALQADVLKVTLGSTLLFQKFRKAIHSCEEVTSWYRSQSSMPMGEPLLSSHLYSEALCESDLFINVFSGGIKVWIWRGKIWALIKEGDPHPHISGYCVSFLQAGEPSWVTKRTIATYRSKRRR